MCQAAKNKDIEIRQDRKLRYRLQDFPHLLRTPLGRIQFLDGTYFRLWPLLSILARWYRHKIVSKTRIVAVVGSYGKSTTTRTTTLALQRRLSEIAPRNSWSYLSGEILSIRPSDRHYVIEVGINGTGQMDQYARMIQPNIVVVTSIGSEHHRSLGSLDVTIEEKGKMVEALSASDLVVLNGDDPNVLGMAARTKAKLITFGFDPSNDIRASNARLRWPEGTEINLHIRGQTHNLVVPLIGNKLIYSILAAIAVADAEEFSVNQILTAIQSVPPASGRLQPVWLPGGAMLLRDDFKSSLETIHTALDVLKEIPAPRRGIVIGDVSEPPGSQGPIYKEIGRRVAECTDYAIVVGSNFQRYAAGAREAGMPESALFNARSSVARASELLRDQIRSGDVVLLKGRDTQRLERIALKMAGWDIRCEISFCDTRAVSCDRCPMLKRGWEGKRVII